MSESQKHDKAIVTIAIGDAYLDMFRNHTLPTWQAYAERHGYDIIVVTEPLDKRDTPGKSFHWQKLLVGQLPQVQDYDQIVWLDGDILINAALAPCIVGANTGGRIGVVEETAEFRDPDEQFNRHTRYLILNHLLSRQLDPATKKAVITDTDLNTYYRLLGLRGDADRMINTGVFAFDPRKYGRFFAEVYTKYNRDFLDFENTPLSFELQEQGVADYLDTRFNQIWAQVAARHYPFLFNKANLEGDAELLRLCVNVAFRNTWFLHFAGGSGNPVVKWAYRMVEPDGRTIPEMVFPEYRDRAEDDVVFCRLDETDAKRREMGARAEEYTLLL